LSIMGKYYPELAASNVPSEMELEVFNPIWGDFGIIIVIGRIGKKVVLRIRCESMKENKAKKEIVFAGAKGRRYARGGITLSGELCLIRGTPLRGEALL